MVTCAEITVEVPLALLEKAQQAAGTGVNQPSPYRVPTRCGCGLMLSCANSGASYRFSPTAAEADGRPVHLFSAA